MGMVRRMVMMMRMASPHEDEERTPRAAQTFGSGTGGMPKVLPTAVKTYPGDPVIRTHTHTHHGDYNDDRLILVIM